MIQFSKAIIEGVSFDSFLFEKELRKLISWFGEDEKQKAIFRLWCIQKFGNQYHEVITDAFKKHYEVNENTQVLVFDDFIS
jgi:hypothetical protein